MTDLVSVIIPCYQQAHFLEECIASLGRQTHGMWEALIVDDGSPDNTRDVAQRLASVDSRVRLISKENGGLSSARNAGLRESRGQWIQFLDADDTIAPTKFQRQIATLNQNQGLTLSYSDYFFCPHEDSSVRLNRNKSAVQFRFARHVLDIALRWEFDLSIPIHCALFPRTLFSELGVVFDETLPNHEDWDMWIQVMSHEPKAIFEPLELAAYRFSPQSMSRVRSAMWRGFHQAIVKQRSVFAGDNDVLHCLSRLERRARFAYGKSLASKWRRALENSPRFRSNCPWRLQQVLRRCTDAPSLSVDCLVIRFGGCN